MRDIDILFSGALFGLVLVLSYEMALVRKEIETLTTQNRTILSQTWGINHGVCQEQPGE